MKNLALVTMLGLLVAAGSASADIVHMGNLVNQGGFETASGWVDAGSDSYTDREHAQYSGDAYEGTYSMLAKVTRKAARDEGSVWIYLRHDANIPFNYADGTKFQLSAFVKNSPDTDGTFDQYDMRLTIAWLDSTETTREAYAGGQGWTGIGGSAEWKQVFGEDEGDGYFDISGLSDSGQSIAGGHGHYISQVQLTSVSYGTTGEGSTIGLLWDNATVLQQQVPEPATMSLLGMGVVGLIARRRRRR